LEVEKILFMFCEEFDKSNLRIVANTEVMEMEVDSTLPWIWKVQLEDETIQEIKHNIKEEKSFRITKGDQGLLWYQGFVCMISRSWRIEYFERLTSPLIPFILEGVRCTMI
jgi:hypothetical protein